MKKILLILALIVTSFAYSQRAGIIFQSLSETSNPTTDWDAFKRCNTNRLIVSNFVKRSGTQSTRFQSRVEDTATCSQVLSQLILNDTNLVNYERWYGFSVFFSSGFTDTYQGYDNFLEFSRASTDENPPLVLSYYGAANGTGYYPTGTYLTAIRYVETPQTEGSPYTIFIDPLWTIQRNAWNDFVIRVKWANDTTGRIRIWLNGRYVYGYNGVTNYSPNLMKIGHNFWNWSKKWKMPNVQGTRELFMDEVRIGNNLSSYLDVLPDSNDPIPNPTSANQFYQVVDNKINIQKISFKVQMDKDYKSNWELRDAITGKRMMSGSFLLFSGYRTYNLNLPFTIPKGTYQFLVGTDRFMHVRRLIKN